MKKVDSGFTLVEILIVLAIISLVAMFAGPSFDDSMKRNRVQSLVKGLSGAMNAARSEAVGRGKYVTICSSSDQVDCDDSSDWSGGWLVFVDDGEGGGTAGNGVLDGTEEILREFDYSGDNSVSGKYVLPGNGTSSGMTHVMFDYRGAALVLDSSLHKSISQASLKVCPSDDDDRHARAILLQATGRTIGAVDLWTGTKGSGSPDGIYEDYDGDNLSCN